MSPGDILHPTLQGRNDPDYFPGEENETQGVKVADPGSCRLATGVGSEPKPVPKVHE